jgi:hypothetical protein
MKPPQLKYAAAQAAAYVNKVGRAERHFSPTTYGKISILTVKTQICHQESSGATNYWDDKEFDIALAAVIKSEFALLSEKALTLMSKQYASARIAEKSSLLAQLAEIEALESGTPP